MVANSYLWHQHIDGQWYLYMYGLLSFQNNLLIAHLIFKVITLILSNVRVHAVKWKGSLNQQEGILAHKVINGIDTCWTTFSIMEMLGIKSNLEILVTWGYHYMQQLNLNSLFAIEPPIWGMAYQVTCAAHHHSVLSRINYDSCICLSHSLQIYVVSMIY